MNRLMIVASRAVRIVLLLSRAMRVLYTVCKSHV